MNIFVVHDDPITAAQMLCDKHVGKMAVESVQQLVSAARRHNVDETLLPLSSKGVPHRGGYHRHPCTVWAGDSRENFKWLLAHGRALCTEFTFRFGKRHACEDQINVLDELASFIPAGHLTNFALCVGPAFQATVGTTHACASIAVPVYRDFYVADKQKFAVWDRGRAAPDWWTKRF